MALRGRLSPFWLCVWTAACVGEAGSTEPPRMAIGEVQAADLCETLVEVVCEAEAACCGADASADCHEVQLSACRETIEPAALDPRTGYDPRAGAAFVEALREDAGTCFREPVRFDDLAGAFAGVVEQDGECTPAGTTAGDLRAAKLSCADGNTCRLYPLTDGSTTGVCEPRADRACSYFYECPTGEWCSLGAEWQPGEWGLCSPLGTNGASCARDLECESGWCAAGACADRPADGFCTRRDYAATVLRDAPVAYWRLADALGGVASDATGNGHDGAYHGSVAVEPSGAIEADTDGAARLSGDASWVQMPAASAMAGASTVSLEAWFAPDAVDVVQPILEYSDGAMYGVHVWAFDQGDKIYANVTDDTGGAHAMMSEPGTVRAGEWQHVVVTYDGSVARLYLNGAVVGQVSGSFQPDVGRELYVGRRPSTDPAGVHAFRGAIDEIAVYDHALGPEAIDRHLAAGLGGSSTQVFTLFR